MATATDTAPLTFTVVEPSHSLIDALIRDDPGLDAQLSNEQAFDTIHRLLTISALSFLLYGLVVGLCWHLVLDAYLLRHALRLGIALTSSFLLALAVCLPSFYFYTQLSGLDASFRLVTAQALRIQARTGVLLLGALPPYVALALGVRLGFSDAWVLSLGLILPYVVGLAGLATLRRSFSRLALRLPVSHQRRRHFVDRIVIAWAAVYSVVCPTAFAWMWWQLPRWL